MFIKYQITLDEDSGEWGKAQPEGLSAIVRELLKVERQRRAARSQCDAKPCPEK